MKFTDYKRCSIILMMLGMAGLRGQRVHRHGDGLMLGSRRAVVFDQEATHLAEMLSAGRVGKRRLAQVAAEGIVAKEDKVAGRQLLLQ